MKSGHEAGSRSEGLQEKREPLQIEADAIRELSALLHETGLTEVEIEEDGRRIRVARQQAPISLSTAVHAASTPSSGAAPHSVAPEKEARKNGQGVIASPMVGTVYVAPEPGKAPFVQVGDSVLEGQTLLIVEAMKTMNPIAAPHAGVVREICVTDAEPVEFGQALMILAPATA